jgi:exopolysaccharide production protein ExoQ
MRYPALLLGIGLIYWLLRKETLARGRLSPPLWIPLIWLLIYCTRPVAAWLGGAGGGSEMEGSQIDAVIIFGLIFFAFITLNKRLFRWNQLVTINAAFALLFGYFILSSIWAPFPFIALKRIFKEFGHVLVVLVILTEKNPGEAMKTVFVRCAHVLLPLSVVLYRWFPEFGRQYSFGGFVTITGVTTQKNSLGQICCYFCLVLIWDIFESKRLLPPAMVKAQLRPKLITLIIGIWLLVLCDSKTSILALSASLAIYFCTYLKIIRRIAPLFGKVFFCVVAVGLVVSAEWTAAIAPALEALGRDPSFTERTRIWEAVLAQKKDTFFGSGFYSFWLSKEGEAVQDTFVNFVPRSSHNGYLEIYLDGGWLGCGFLFIFLLYTSFRLANSLSHENSFNRILFGMTMTALIINFSEACFFRLDILWFCLVMAAMIPPAILLQGRLGNRLAETHPTTD